MNQSVDFNIVYDGESLQNHSMNIKDLAPALLALGNLFDEANRILNGEDVLLKLHVKAHEAGSFEVLLNLYQSLPKQISSFLTGDFVTSVLNLKELIFSIGTAGTGGIFWLIKKLNGKAPDKITDLKNGFIRIELGGEVLDIPEKLLRLYQDFSIRKASEEVLKPLTKDGIDIFKVKEKNKIIESVRKEELHYFVVPEIKEEEILCTESEKSYSIISLTFKDDNKWRLWDGASTINVTIHDQDFKNKVDDNKISFSKNDILRCRIRTRQWRTESGLKIEHEVLEVIEHIPSAKQLLLF